MFSRFAGLLGLVLLAGCSSSSSSTPPAGKGVPVAVDPPSVAANPGAGAGPFAKEFLKALHDGTATPAQLTPAFKKVIAEPVFDADQALGFSDSAAANWLKPFQGKLPSFALSSPTIAEAALYTGTVPAEKPLQFLMRVVKYGDGWAVDWLSLTEVTPATAPAGDATAQSFAALAFLQALLGHKDDLAAGAMTAAQKKNHAPAFGSEKKPFNAGILKTKFNGYRGNFTGYNLTKVENGIATGELVKADGKKPFTLKLAAGERPNEWLVDEIKVD